MSWNCFLWCSQINNVSGHSFAVSSAFGSNIKIRVHANFYNKYLGFFLELGVQQGLQNDRKGDMMFDGWWFQHHLSSTFLVIGDFLYVSFAIEQNCSYTSIQLHNEQLKICLITLNWFATFGITYHRHMGFILKLSLDLLPNLASS